MGAKNDWIASSGIHSSVGNNALDARERLPRLKRSSAESLEAQAEGELQPAQASGRANATRVFTPNVILVLRSDDESVVVPLWPS